MAIVKRAPMRATATLNGTKPAVIKRSEVKHHFRYTVQVRSPVGAWFERIQSNDWNEVVGYVASQGAPDEFRIVDNSEHLEGITTLYERAACVIAQRDHMAEFAKYDTTRTHPGPDQQFDDWAADYLQGL